MGRSAVTHVQTRFDSFEKKPVAAASLAQVHHATKDGQEFAVKVQFPDIRTKAFADVNTIDSLVTVASWVSTAHSDASSRSSNAMAVFPRVQTSLARA